MDAGNVGEYKLAIMDLALKLRASAPIGAIGLMEMRNLFANLFPEFADVRDSELDDSIIEYASRLNADPDFEKPPSTLDPETRG